MPPFSMRSPTLVLWEAARDTEIAARVAIAGDFLPAGRLAFPARCGWREMAGSLASHFQDVAATFLNLECPVDVEGLVPRPLAGVGQIVQAPPGSLQYLQAIHCAAAGIANNHACDYGLAGVGRTREALAKHAILPLGTGRTLSAPPEISVRLGRAGVRVGFWASARATQDPASSTRPGVEPATLPRGRQALQRMKDQGAQFCIALLHAGVARTNYPAPEDVRRMDSLARAGFHVVAAAHSHRITGFGRIGTESGQPSFCFYGLGSLVSGYAPSPLEREGLIVVAALGPGGNLARLEVRPVLLDASGFGTVPEPEIGRVILQWFERLSGEIADGSFERRFYEDVSNGLLRFYARDARTAFRESGFRGLARKAARLRMHHLRRLAHTVVG